MTKELKLKFIAHTAHTAAMNARVAAKMAVDATAAAHRAHTVAKEAEVDIAKTVVAINNYIKAMEVKDNE